MLFKGFEFCLVGLLTISAVASAENLPRLSTRLKGYAILAGGNLEYVCSNIEGAIAAQGTVRLNRMSVGTGHTLSTPAVSSQGSFSLLDGSITGNVEAGTDATLHHYFAKDVSAGGNAYCSSEGTSSSCRSGVSPSVFVVNLMQEWAVILDQLKNLSANQVNLSSAGELRIVVSSVENVFEVQASDLVGAKRILIEGSPSQSVVVKVRGNSVEWKGSESGVQLSGGIQPQQVTWLFLDADKVAIHHMLIPGTVMIPNGSVSLYEGSIEGSIYVRGSVVGNPMKLSLSQRISCVAGSSGAKIVGSLF